MKSESHPKLSKLAKNEGYTASLKTSRARIWSWNIFCNGWSSLRKTKQINFSKTIQQVVWYDNVNIIPTYCAQRVTEVAKYQINLPKYLIQVNTSSRDNMWVIIFIEQTKTQNVMHNLRHFTSIKLVIHLSNSNFKSCSNPLRIMHVQFA